MFQQCSSARSVALLRHPQKGAGRSTASACDVLLSSVGGPSRGEYRFRSWCSIAGQADVAEASWPAEAVVPLHTVGTASIAALRLCGFGQRPHAVVRALSVPQPEEERCRRSRTRTPRARTSSLSRRPSRRARRVPPCRTLTSTTTDSPIARSVSRLRLQTRREGPI